MESYRWEHALFMPCVDAYYSKSRHKHILVKTSQNQTRCYTRCYTIFPYDCAVLVVKHIIPSLPQGTKVAQWARVTSHMAVYPRSNQSCNGILLAL